VKLPHWIATMFQSRSAASLGDADKIDVLRRELAKPPEAFAISDLVPMLVPRAFSETEHWPGPIYRLAAGDFDQTWAVLRPDDAIVYVSRPMQALWEAQGQPWRQIADENLRRLAETEPFSHVSARDDGSAFMVNMLYGQNMGPSRLLVPDLLKSTFPGGYRVAVPEMTCAVAFTSTPSRDEAKVIDDLIANLFEHGREPVSSARFAPDALWQFASGDLGLAQ